jgi:hypothetical protein
MKTGDKYKAKSTTVVNGVGVKAGYLVTIEAVFKSGAVIYEVGSTGVVLHSHDSEYFLEKFEKAV